MGKKKQWQAHRRCTSAVSFDWKKERSVLKCRKMKGETNRCVLACIGSRGINEFWTWDSLWRICQICAIFGIIEDLAGLPNRCLQL